MTPNELLILLIFKHRYYRRTPLYTQEQIRKIFMEEYTKQQKLLFYLKQNILNTSS